MNTNSSVTRRTFLAAAAGAPLVAGSLASASFLQDKQEMKVALIGCGGRGNGALKDAMEAAKINGLSMTLVATADWFKDRAEGTGKEYGLDPAQCYGGAEAYKKVCESDADVILMATAPLFRPIHFRAAIEAGKHVFMEKPVAVDPVGCRHIIETGEMAKQKKLSVVAGTQRRHQAPYLAQKAMLDEGDLGAVRGGSVWWDQGQLWYKERNDGESEADYLIRNWVNFMEMNGDMIAEQHVHNIDVALWFVGRPPQSAMGYGARHRRVTGNQYDQFSTDFDFGEGVHIHSQCRQINGCANNVSEFLAYEKGEVWVARRAQMTGGEVMEPSMSTSDLHENPYVQEHVDLQRSIMNGDAVNEAEQVTNSCAAAIMGRIAAYTGERVLWDDMMTNADSELYNMQVALKAEDFESGNVTLPEEGVAPVPGE